MNITVHEINGTKVAEMQSKGIIIRSARDAADVIGQLLARGIKKLILHERNLSPEFWQLPSGLAVEILKKFADNAIAVAFVGDFSQKKSIGFQTFMEENNLGNQVVFSDNVEHAEMRLSG